MNQSQIYLLIAALGYLIISAGISRYIAWAKHPIQKVSDYTVAGRKVGLTLMSATFIATWCSSYSLFACGETSYAVGLSGMIWYPIGVAGPVLAMYGIARWVKRKVPQGWTIGDFVGKLYGDKARFIVAGIVLIAMLFEVTAAIFAGSTLLNTLTDFPILWGAIILGATFIFYTTLGGLWAVVYGDLIRVLTFMVLGLVAVPVLLIQVGGVSFLYNELSSDFFNVNAWGISGMQNFWILLFAYTAGSAAVWQRVFAARDEEVIDKGFFTFAMGWFPFAIAGGILGFLARIATTEEILAANAVPTTISTLAPFGLQLLLLIALLAVITSSADSFFNAAVSTYAVDFEGKIFSRLTGNDRSDSLILRNTKIFAVIFGVLSIFFASYVRTIIGLLVYNSYIFLGIIFVVVAAVFTDKITKKGAISGMVVGLIVSIGGFVVGIDSLLATLLTIALSAIATVGISLLDPVKLKITYETPPAERFRGTFTPGMVYTLYAGLIITASYPLWTTLIWGTTRVIAPLWLTQIVFWLAPIGVVGLIIQLSYYAYRDREYKKSVEEVDA